LVVTSSGFGVKSNNIKIADEASGPAILPSGSVVSGESGEGWTGYLKAQ
jgi:hypothetical protein